MSSIPFLMHTIIYDFVIGIFQYVLFFNILLNCKMHSVVIFTRKLWGGGGGGGRRWENTGTECFLFVQKFLLT